MNYTNYYFGRKEPEKSKELPELQLYEHKKEFGALSAKQMHIAAVLTGFVGGLIGSAGFLYIAPQPVEKAVVAVAILAGGTPAAEYGLLKGSEIIDNWCERKEAQKNAKI